MGLQKNYEQLTGDSIKFGDTGRMEFIENDIVSNGFENNTSLKFIGSAEEWRILSDHSNNSLVIRDAGNDTNVMHFFQGATPRVDISANFDFNNGNVLELSTPVSPSAGTDEEVLLRLQENQTNRWTFRGEYSSVQDLLIDGSSTPAGDLKATDGDGNTTTLT